MKNIPALTLGLVLLGFAAHASAAPNCTIKLQANDQMQYDLKTATVSASCATIDIQLVHTGKLPIAAMGHNVVISATTDVSALSMAGMKAGAAAHYMPKGDARVIAATPMIGGGGKTSAKFAGGKLKAGGDYSFFCSFPGHSGIMKGKLVVTK